MPRRGESPCKDNCKKCDQCSFCKIGNLAKIIKDCEKCVYCQGETKQEQYTNCTQACRKGMRICINCRSQCGE